MEACGVGNFKGGGVGLLLWFQVVSGRFWVELERGMGGGGLLEVGWIWGMNLEWIGGL